MILGDAVVLLACLLVSATLLLAVVGLTWFIDRYDREPLHLVAAVFLWGAAGAPTLAVLTLTGLERLGLGAALPGLLSTAVAGPLTEELCKGLGVVLVVLLARSLDNPTDGLVYGTAAGLGFAVTENALYGMGAGAAGEATVGGLPIHAVPAYNLLHKRENGQPFHPKGVGNGYVLEFGDLRVYVAGDTEDVPDMSDLGAIDVAFLPANLPYTMSIDMVVEAARKVRPPIVYPYHFGKTDTAALKRRLESEVGCEARIRRLA